MTFPRIGRYPPGKANRSSSCSQEVDDLTLIRFLRVCNQNVEKVGSMFLKYLEWRRNFVPKGYVSEAEIQHELSQNKVLIGGEDKKGCPIVVVFAGRHYQNSKPGGLDEFKRTTLPALDSYKPGGLLFFSSSNLARRH